MGANGRVIVTGCMGLGDDAAKIKQLNPEVLSVSGPADVESVVSAVNQFAPHPEINPPHFHHHAHKSAGIKLTPRHYAYLKISEGCNHRCSFCIIPSMRGDLVSRPIDEVYAEAERLVDNGVRELLVVSQDTSAYGVDTRYKLGFINGVAYEAGLGADTVRGIDDSATPYTYSLRGGLSSASAAAVSISAMDGNNGAWGVLAGNPAMTTGSVGMYALEDQAADNERAHTTAQMCYIVFE